MNSSTLIPACLRMPRRVPIASSECNGTTQPVVVSGSIRLITTWLPRCRAWTKPNRSKARIACAPETRGSLGKMSLENGYERPADFARRKLFQVEFSCLTKVRHGIFYGLTLAHRAYLGAFSYV